MKKCTLPILILTASLLSWSIPGWAQPSNRYCNSRFDFCLNYPSPPFRTPIESDNHDGARLESDDLGVLVEVSASSNVLNWTLEEIRKFEEEEMEAAYGKLAFETRLSRGKGLEMSFEANELPHFFKVIERDGVHVFLRVWATKPINPDLFDQLKSQIELVPRL